jgi:hypothetical protein
MGFLGQNSRNKKKCHASVPLTGHSEQKIPEETTNVSHSGSSLAGFI